MIKFVYNLVLSAGSIPQFLQIEWLGVTNSSKSLGEPPFLRILTKFSFLVNQSILSGNLSLKMSMSLLSNSGQSSVSLMSVRSKPSNKNLQNMREKTRANIYPKGFIYQPKVSEKFLEEWLDFPTKHTNVLLNILTLPFVWLLHTNKAMAGLDPSSSTVRERLSNQCSVLGTAAGLFLVIAIAGFLAPPKPQNPDDQILVDVFGVLMFAASINLVMYIGLSLTNMYPLVQSLRDDIAFDAFEVYMNRWGGYELYMFNVGFQFILFALLIACRVIYSAKVVFVLLAIFVAVYG